MKRRKFLSSVATGGLAGWELTNIQAFGQEPEGSVYIPSHHRVDDLKAMHDLMDEFSFASVITAAPSLRVTHIPIVLDRGAGKYGRLTGHVARNNPQHHAFDGKQPALIVFQGPHRYISPSWFNKEKMVPTWNFAVVHASGRPRANEDPKFLYDFLNRLIAKNESYEKSEWNLSKVPEAYKAGLITGIVALEMDIELLEGKFKLGLDAAPADQEKLLAGLKGAANERTLYEFTRERAALAGHR
jgi:transcriptional regulator